MNLVALVLLLVLLGIGYRVGLSRSRRQATAGGVKQHSRPGYHGMLVAIWCLVPALIVLLGWAIFEGPITEAYVTSHLPSDVVDAGGGALSSAIQRVTQLANGARVSTTAADYELSAADALRDFRSIAGYAAIVVAAVLGIAGLYFAQRRIAPRLRARNEVETVIRILLVLASAIAILTTIGIVASLIGQALEFFSFVSPLDFFFGTVWAPGFSSTSLEAQGEYGLLPLLAGTVLISVIAMLIAVPVGLFAAIYMSEYAPRIVRKVAKPIIEILAGIPTIVYGIFALFTVGPFLRDVGDLVGLDINATSALTAGVVMGIMIIPFISSLSDDIITQVPRSMRDGSYGLGATRSETMRRVLLPAALPGIVGAFLLAVSRAIGETMIVVLAAGNSPVLTGNPFEAVSTITVTIVKQLTGDAEFRSAQSLVAFALGLTLFVMTLGLNIIALRIVRKYREQYE